MANEYQCSSGNPIKYNADGMPSYNKGQIRLGAAIAYLPLHHFDKNTKPSYFGRVMAGVDLVPEQVLHLVAEEIDELVNADAIKHAPRLKDIQSMCVNVMQMQRALEKFVATRKASLSRRQRTT